MPAFHFVLNLFAQQKQLLRDRLRRFAELWEIIGQLFARGHVRDAGKRQRRIDLPLRASDRHGHTAGVRQRFKIIERIALLPDLVQLLQKAALGADGVRRQFRHDVRFEPQSRDAVHLLDGDWLHWLAHFACHVEADGQNEHGRPDD